MLGLGSYFSLVTFDPNSSASDQLCIFLQPQNSIAVYLTFDDGPEHGTTQVLDSLKKYGVRATFFINSDNFSVMLNLFSGVYRVTAVVGIRGWVDHEQ